MATKTADKDLAHLVLVSMVEENIQNSERAEKENASRNAILVFCCVVEAFLEALHRSKMKPEHAREVSAKLDLMAAAHSDFGSGLFRTAYLLREYADKLEAEAGLTS